MSKILLIIQREYSTRVKKKSFIIMTLLGPLLMALVMIVPIWIVSNSSDGKSILVIDESNLFIGNLKNSEKISFTFSNENIDSLKNKVGDYYDGLLYIPKLNLDSPKGITFYSEKSVGATTLILVEKQLSERILDLKYTQNNLDKALISSLKTNINIQTISLSGEDEKATSTEASMAIGLITSVLIYMFIFMYGTQVMRGVIEEKTNRIIEVIVSSVKPFELMMGKVVGIALVGLTQFIIWIFLTSGVYLTLSVVFAFDRFSDTNLQQTISANPQINMEQAMEMNEIMAAINSINFPVIIASFLFFFLAGYLFYAALFAAIGAAVDNETDTQQFLFPITIPLILAMVVAQGIITDPESKTAFWFSIVPFTSPIVMMLRLPFIGFNWEVALSMILLVLGFLGTIWVAAKVYRVGILLYGKKVTYKELSKWIFKT